MQTYTPESLITLPQLTLSLQHEKKTFIYIYIQEKVQLVSEYDHFHDFSVDFVAAADVSDDPLGQFYPLLHWYQNTVAWNVMLTC